MGLDSHPLHVIFTVYNADSPGSINDITRRQAEHLVGKGYRVTLVTNRAGVSWAGVENCIISVCDAGFWRLTEYCAEGLSRRLPEALSSLSLKDVVEQSRFPIAAARAVAELCRRERVDGIVACQHVLVFGLKWLRRRCGIPFIIVSHGDIFEHPTDSFSAPTNWLYRRAARQAAVDANRVIAVSHRLRERTIAIGAPPGRVEVVYNGIEQDDIGGHAPARPRAKPLELLSVGRLCPEKGIDVLLRAAALLTNTEIRLTIIGDGPERKRLNNLARDLQISHFVEFIGQLPRNQVGRYYKACDIVVLPSRSDAMPLVSLEAMTMGRPLAGTLVGGIPEIVEQGITGLLVRPDDPAALSSTLMTLFESPELRARMGSAASERAKLFTWPKLLNQFEGIVQREFAGSKVKSDVRGQHSDRDVVLAIDRE